MARSYCQELIPIRVDIMRNRIRRAAAFWLFLLAAVLVCFLDADRAMSAGRSIRPLDRDWRFHKGEAEGAQEISFNDSAWLRVDVPHDWGIEGPFDRSNPAGREGGYLPTGVGWYRKTFSLPASESNRKVFVEFDGVMANSDVWINGHHLGKRPSGYVSFRYELTPHLRFGENEKNVLAVRTDTSEQVASRWYTGSGIYRHVRLVVVDPVHIDASSVFVHTTENANVVVLLEVKNLSKAPRDVALQTKIVDDTGRVAATEEMPLSAAPGGTFRVQSLAVANPRLWDLESGHLYTAVTSVVTDGQTVDEVRTPFGIREAAFKAETGFWLNGRNVKIKGVCLHHDGGAFGAAVPLSIWRYRLERLRELGVNAIRTAHNPPAPEFLDLCDEMGFLVMDEFFDCWTVGKRTHDYHKFFDEWAHRDLRDTILRDRNHPSIILWSVGNEIHDTPREELAKRILRGLVDVCHEADPTRPVTQALFRPNVSHDYDNGLADMLDVIGTNYRDQELLAAWWAKPTRKIIGTEQGHDRGVWLAARDNPQHAGQFLWCGIDYLGESFGWPTTTFNAGLLDRTGHVQPRGWERQSWWSEKPMVRAFRRIAANERTPTDPGYEAVEWRRRQVLYPDWSPREESPGEVDVEVYSNYEEVELVLNNRSLGVKALPRDARPRNWRVPFEAGKLVAISRNSEGEVARDILTTAGKPARVLLKSNRDQIAPIWDDVAVIEAQVVDENGNVVPTAADQISFNVTGPGRVVAVDSGSIVSHELFQTNERRAFQGRCVAYVRATDSRGAIEVMAAAVGLVSGSIMIGAAGN
jgi:beta-galactosidase